LAVFFAVHLVPTMPGFRSLLVERMGELPYKGAFALASLLGLILIVLGKGGAPHVALWTPPAWGAGAARFLMPLAFFLVVAAYVPCNVRWLTRHPMLWGVSIWALAHLLANGDAASVLLFGSFLLYATYDMWSASQREPVLLLERRPLKWDLAAVGIAFAAFLLVAFLHGRLFGAPAFS
jgi:uncharacterized membrane protein